MAKKLTKVVMIVLHFRGKRATKACLDSARKLKTKGLKLEILVVDNNPKDNLKDLKSQFKNFEFLETKKNLGFTGGNNFGIKKALADGADWVFLVNNDTILDKNLVVQLVKAGRADEGIGILGPKIYFAPGHEYHRERYRPSDRGKVFWYAGGLVDWQNILSSHRGVDEIDQGQYDQQEETDFVTGCAMLIKRSVFEKIGRLDDRYYLYLEDLDFCRRAEKAGFGVVFVPQAKLWHANAGSSVVGGELHDYFFSRNRMLFGFHFASWRAKFALFRESVTILVKGRPWQKRGVKDFYLKKFGRGSWYG